MDLLTYNIDIYIILIADSSCISTRLRLCEIFEKGTSGVVRRSVFIPQSYKTDRACTHTKLKISDRLPHKGTSGVV